MKKCILLIVLIVIFSGGLVFSYISVKRYNMLSDDLYKEFLDNEVVGVDGDVNLIQLENKRDNLYSEIISLFNVEYSEDNYLKMLDDIGNNNISLGEEIEKISSEITSLESKKKSLNEQYDVLNKKYNSLIYSASNKSYNFPLINQIGKYPTGCESVALTMLLRYYGVNITPDQVIGNLKKGEFTLL